MSDILNFAFSEARRSTSALRSAKCREIAAEIERLDLSAVNETRDRWVELAGQLRTLADDLEHAATKATNRRVST